MRPREILSLIPITVLPIAVVSLAGCASDRAATGEPADRASSNGYPVAARGDTVDVYHGVEVADPYRWMEDPEALGLAEWIEAENTLTYDYLGSVEQRDVIRDRLTELWNYERVSTPGRRGGKYLFSRNDGLQNQSVLMVADSANGTPRVLIDPNTLSEDGTVALGGTSMSPDGRYLAYAIADGGSDWRIWKVRDVRTGQDLGDEIRWSKFSGAAWNADSTGFYYTRFPEPEADAELQAANTNSKIFFHRVGTLQSEDELIFEQPDHPERGVYAGTSDDGRYLVLFTRQGTDPNGGILVKDLSVEGSEFIEILPLGVAQASVIDHDGNGNVWLSTRLDSPRGRVVRVSLENPSPSAWEELIPESEATISSASIVGERLILNTLRDAKSEVRGYDLEGRPLGVIELPGIGNATGFSGERGNPETFFSFRSFNTPAAVYRLDTSNGEVTPWFEPELGFDSDDYKVSQVFYSSKDGTRVPMFIAHHKGVSPDTFRPTLLYGYGGFNVSIEPFFSPSYLQWMEMGGVVAVANIRGGGEYGADWHDAGRLLNKQNCFDDFIAAGEWLVRAGYTRPERLAIYGGSNGGLLVAACSIQRPDLFGAAIPAVGVHDMLRFDKFTIGYAWRSDYGWPEKNEAEFRNNLAFSPLHTVDTVSCLPNMMITTADRDDRVVPAHSFKFAAAAQASQECDNVVLIRIETRAGHGAGTPTSKRIEAATDNWAFLWKSLGMSVEDAPN
ncbi:MAG: prolyl oligopeptidase family serine peptidase [Planctomycetota bacterium]